MEERWGLWGRRIEEGVSVRLKTLKHKVNVLHKEFYFYNIKFTISKLL